MKIFKVAFLILVASSIFLGVTQIAYSDLPICDTSICQQLPNGCAALCQCKDDPDHTAITCNRWALGVCDGVVRWCSWS